MLLTVPKRAPGESRWPTLGPQVCDWIEAYCVHGPGDVLGEPVVLDAEQRAIVYSAYEVFPQGHSHAGRRRFYRAGLSLRRGRGKTEFASWFAAAELHPDAPVRCDGFDARGEPVGVPVTSPLVLVFAASEEQADDTGFEALRQCILQGPLDDDFEVNLDLIARLDGSGRAKTLAAAPNSAEGRLVTFAWFSETHRAIRPALKQAHKVIRDGMPKRLVGDPWALEETTAFVPGEGSIAEGTFEYAQAIADGRLDEPRLFFFHRQASDHHDLSAREGRRAAVIEATGPAALAWTDVDRVVHQWEEPDCDPERLEQVWLNRPVQSSAQAVDVTRWDELAVDAPVIPEQGRLIVLGFDGSAVDDTTGLVGTDVETGYQWVVAHWDPRDKLQCPSGEVPVDEVALAVDETFATWRVARMHCDPYHWRELVDSWAGTYGREIVVAWWTNQHRKAAFAVDRWSKAQRAGDLIHSGDGRLRAHVANARRRPVEVRDPETGRRLYLLRKDRPDSPSKIDLADASWLSWEARGDARALALTGAQPTGAWAY